MRASSTQKSYLSYYLNQRNLAISDRDFFFKARDKCISQHFCFREIAKVFFLGFLPVVDEECFFGWVLWAKKCSLVNDP